MHTKYRFLPLLLAALAPLAGAQVVTNMGGHIDIGIDNPVPIVHTGTAQGLLGDPQYKRYFSDVYARSIEGSSGTIEWVTDPIDRKSMVFRASVVKPSTGYARAEVSPRWEYTKTGKRWYALSVLFPTWDAPNVDMIVWQLHTSQNTKLGEAVLSPPLDVVAKGRYLYLGMHANELSNKVSDPVHATKEGSSKQYFRIAAVETGKWLCFVVAADWSHTPGSGAMKVWMGGKLVYEADKAFNSYISHPGNYLKTGLYVPGVSNMEEPQSLYMGYSYFGGENSTYAEMAAQTKCGA